MYGPAVRRKRFLSIWRLCGLEFGSRWERDVLRTIMDISALAISRVYRVPAGQPSKSKPKISAQSAA